MNKKKLIKNVSLVALSAVMIGGTAASFAACKPGVKPYELTVNIFCDATDKATNKQICDTWAAEYTKKLRANGTIGEDVTLKVNFESQSDRDAYFNALNTDFVRNRAADIVYVQPRNVKSWARRGLIMDLSDFINASTGEAYEENIANIQGLWQDVLSFYGYDAEAEEAGKYAMGDSLKYYKEGETLPNGTAVTRDTAGFYTTKNSTQVGVYGLPKDYSNFAMGFNGRYFSEALKYAYQTTTPGTSRSVKGAEGNPAMNTYTGANDTKVATFAASGTYELTNPWTGAKETKTATKGQPAPLIAIGVPVTYKPYNFYAFDSWEAAIDGGDPVAKAVNEFTRGQGYTVTLPGFPGDSFEVPESWNAKKDANAPYNNNIGHITFTYAEYSALTWAVTYFCNTFNFRAVQDATADTFAASMENAKKGTAGVVKMDGSSPENVFGNDQYEGAPNPTLYLLPWLAGNDANFISSDSQVAINATKKGEIVNDQQVTAAEYDYSNGGVSWKRTEVPKDSKGGTLTEKVPKLRLNGETEMVDVQYGVNSEKFIETYGAFLAYGSDWNGNSGNSRAPANNQQKEDNGWSLFRNGACIFYGAGTWDNKTKNESPTTLNGETFCEFRSMTMPIGESYALYSNIKNAYYKMEKYGGECKIYTEAEILENQMTRQDKWGARMDSVGFALNDAVRKEAEKNKDSEWKLQGAAELIMTLSAEEKSQHDLTLGGAQLPNFKQQCIDFLHYQTKADGAFADMVTPEGFATTKYWADGKEGIEKNPDGVAEAEKIWTAYNTVVKELDDASKTGSADLNKTFGTWFGEKYPSGKIGDTGVDLKYDEQYKDMTLKQVLTGELSHRAAAMKVLKMTTYRFSDRDLQLRMQYGVNAVRDAAMYTYETGWINDISMRDGSNLCYTVQAPIKDGTIMSKIKMDHTLDEKGKPYMSPSYFCFLMAEKVQQDLELSMKNEADSLNKK